MAQAPATSSTLYLKFLDAASGAALSPSSITVNGTSTPFQVEAGSLVALPLGDGNFNLEVTADNYTPFQFTAAVTGADTPIMEIELDKAQPDNQAPLTDGQAALEGFVTDADTGALIAGAVVTLPDAALTTTTSTDGRFELVLQVPPATDDAIPAITMEARAEGFTPVRIKNLALSAGDRRTMPVKLSRATSETLTAEFDEQDEGTPDGPLRTFDWVFDVTIR